MVKRIPIDKKLNLKRAKEAKEAKRAKDSRPEPVRRGLRRGLRLGKKRDVKQKLITDFFVKPKSPRYSPKRVYYVNDSPQYTSPENVRFNPEIKIESFGIEISNDSVWDGCDGIVKEFYTTATNNGTIKFLNILVRHGVFTNTDAAYIYYYIFVDVKFDCLVSILRKYDDLASSLNIEACFNKYKEIVPIFKDIFGIDYFEKSPFIKTMFERAFNHIKGINEITFKFGKN